MEIQATKRYSQFKFRESNREIRRDHVNSLKRAISAENLLALNPILVARGGEVLDGQHRLLAAKELGVEIFYIEAESLDGSEIGMMNTVRRGWNIKDYIHYWAKEGNGNYKWLEKGIKSTDLLVSPLLELTGKEHGKIKSGEFEMDESEREVFDTRLMMLEEYMECDDNLKNARAQRAFVRLMKRGEFDHGQMVRKLKECSGKIEVFASNIDMMREIERIYNHQKHNKVRIF